MCTEKCIKLFSQQDRVLSFIHLKLSLSICLFVCVCVWSQKEIHSLFCISVSCIQSYSYNMSQTLRLTVGAGAFLATSVKLRLKARNDFQTLWIETDEMALTTKIKAMQQHIMTKFRRDLVSISPIFAPREILGLFKTIKFIFFSVQD